VIDGSGLIDWLQQFPAVEQWLAATMGFPAQHLQTPEQRWADLRTIGNPPPLTPHVFLANRDKACEKLMEVFSGTAIQLQLDTHFPDQIVDFVAADITAMQEDARIDTVGRCLIVSGTEAWNAITTLREPHVLIADFDLDEADTSGTRLLEKARRARHAVIFGGRPSGIPHPNRVPLLSPKSYQVKEALKKAGYSEERSRSLAQKSDGNLSALLRCLQNLSLMPEWAEGTHAAELAIAEVLGAWDEKSEADRTIVKNLSGNSYGEWIGKMREIALRPGTPLIQRDGVWKVVARYEGWYAIGPRLFDEHLNRLRQAAVVVLKELNPAFELPPEKRNAASIYGIVLTHSHALRKGFADCLALLGSHPKALTSCSFNKAEETAVLTVREVLTGADWVLWSSLNDLLPLLAEAAPGEFLGAIEKALISDPCPFDTVFAQEDAGFMGSNYMTGLLWALETLAWDAEYLIQVAIILSELAARDSDGKWASRPINSLTAILLPWLPQTCASVAKRKVAVTTLIDEFPDVAWKLLLSLLPQSRQSSFGSSKPVWREIIPDDWSSGVTLREYWEQADIYAELAISVAKSDLSKLSDLIDRLDDLPLPAHEHILEHLGADAIVSMPQADRFQLWTRLVSLVSKHRKFADARWAMKPEQVDKIAAVAKRLAPESPAHRHRRLFSEQNFGLYEERGNYEEQRNALEERRQRATAEVCETGGVEALVEFAQAVETPWRVGMAFGTIAENAADSAILPELLESENNALMQFSGGFVQGRFRIRGWQWVDDLDTSQWTPTQTGQLLAYLPFTPETWQRSARLLGDDESPFWTKTNAHPYDTDKGLELAADCLVEYGRPHAAIRCLSRMRADQQPFDSQRAVRALLAAGNSSESAHAMDVDDIVEVIKALQDDRSTNPDDLFHVESAYLPLLDQQYGASPKFLEQRLAVDPGFFCEVIRILSPSEKAERPAEEPTGQQKNLATHAYRLLRQWRTPPGGQQDGTFSGDALAAWLNEVKEVCTESGHLKIALSRIGHVLIHTPSDPDGLWIHHSVAAVLNARDANDIRDGFQAELYNSRGVYHFTEGQEERELAAKYRTQADEVELRGYYRLAQSLRDLADSYERDAERDQLRELFDD
jgi:hypothetical protein